MLKYETQEYSNTNDPTIKTYVLYPSAGYLAKLIKSIIQTAFIGSSLVYWAIIITKKLKILQ
ncbi:MAG TPA: hypothetical protein ENJ51_09515 [Leucothrix mucor]|uniref:Uncharacterized protein n=1 Tax=Leucothrix mucor TaxID=45248 RepID=A0A7V2WVT6_LEUMU|nr:hypothetical protein [Leucothrix mucor]